MADNEHPPSRDLEPRAKPPVDPEQYRQFEQFQQFQEFLAYKEAQGDGAPPPMQLPGRQRPMWKKILFSRAVRKLAYLLVVILAIVWAYNHFFPGPVDDGLGTQGAAGPGQQAESGKGSGTPGAAVESLYDYAARGNQTGFNQKQDFATLACTLFDDNGRAAFVQNFGGTDCATIIRGLTGKVASLQLTPLVDITDKRVVQLSSCRDLQVKPGTMGLGEFTITRLGDGWIISGHKAEPNPCPVTPSAPPTTTTSR